MLSTISSLKKNIIASKIPHIQYCCTQDCLYLQLKNPFIPYIIPVSTSNEPPLIPQLQDQLTGSMKLLEDCRTLLNERRSELLQLAEDCLMILYLEIRVQCYYHLLIVLRKVNFDDDFEPSLKDKLSTN